VKGDSIANVAVEEGLVDETVEGVGWSKKVGEVPNIAADAGESPVGMRCPKWSIGALLLSKLSGTRSCCVSTEFATALSAKRGGGGGRAGLSKKLKSSSVRPLSAKRLFPSSSNINALSPKTFIELNAAFVVMSEP
jgi:hypothetical protein